MNNQKGNTSVIIAVVGLVIVAVAGYFMYTSTTGRTNTETTDAMMEETSEGDESMMESEGAMTSYTGTVLAGEESPYIEFNQDDYEKALSDGKTIFLIYYADWCPICRAEQPDIQAGFDQINNPDFIGFRVNYNDTSTDNFEKSLADEHGVTYQHTKVILKDGEVVLKDGEVWDTEHFITEVNSVL